MCVQYSTACTCMLRTCVEDLLEAHTHTHLIFYVDRLCIIEMYAETCKLLTKTCRTGFSTISPDIIR